MPAAGATALTDLVKLWLHAEDAYFTNAKNYGPGDYVRLEARGLDRGLRCLPA